MEASYPNHIWSIDITYIPIQKSWLYLTAIIDWYSRYVISWAIDDTLEISFVLDACKHALKYSKPCIMNSDQGSHFTSPKYVSLFLDAGAHISMDHRDVLMTIFLLNGFGAVSSTKIFTLKITAIHGKPDRESGNIWTFITMSVHIRALVIKHRLKFILAGNNFLPCRNFT